MPALTFTDPQRLWWLLLLLPVLFWLALPPRPSRVLWTAHMPQWRLAHAALRRRPPRLSGPRLLLLALACAAAVAAHAGPVLAGRPGPSRLVVLLDASASMRAVGADGTAAFDAARAALRAGLAAVPEHVDVTLLRCGGPMLRRHGQSARELHDFGPPQGPLVADLAALAQAAQAADTAVWTLTDGQGQSALPRVGALTVVGRPGANAALLAVRTEDRWPLPGLALAIDVVAFADAPCPGELRVQGPVAAVPPMPVALVPGQVTTLALELERTAAGGQLAVSIAVAGDVLPDDDVFRAELPPLPAPRIAVLTEGEAGPFARVAAAALAAEVAGTVVEPAPGADVGLLLLDGGVAAIEPGRVRALCFGTRRPATASPAAWLEPRVADWDRVGLLTAGLDLSELVVHAAFPETLPAGDAFLWADDGSGGRAPLGVVASGAEAASIHFAFRLQDSNLPLLPAFPQLLRRAFVLAHGKAARLQVATPEPAAGEQDLRIVPRAEDRPLPAFSTPDRGLSPYCLLAGLLALALRAFVR